MKSPMATPIRCLGSFSVENTPYGKLSKVKSLNVATGIKDIVLKNNECLKWFMFRINE